MRPSIGWNAPCSVGDILCMLYLGLPFFREKYDCSHIRLFSRFHDIRFTIVSSHSTLVDECYQQCLHVYHNLPFWLPSPLKQSPLLPLSLLFFPLSLWSTMYTLPKSNVARLTHYLLLTLSMYVEGTVVCCSQDQGSLETKSEPLMTVFLAICEGKVLHGITLVN